MILAFFDLALTDGPRSWYRTPWCRIFQMSRQIRWAIAHQTGQLDMRFLQQPLPLAAQTHLVLRQLVLATAHRSPHTLFGIGHKALHQLLRHQSLEQPLGILEIVLSPASRPIRFCLRQLQRPRLRPRAFPLPPLCLPIPYQRLPHRPPVLRCRFHHHFFDCFVDQPLRQRL
jgi:hypothetical protein